MTTQDNIDPLRIMLIKRGVSLCDINRAVRLILKKMSGSAVMSSVDHDNAILFLKNQKERESPDFINAQAMRR